MLILTAAIDLWQGTLKTNNTKDQDTQITM